MAETKINANQTNITASDLGAIQNNASGFAIEISKDSVGRTENGGIAIGAEYPAAKNLSVAIGSHATANGTDYSSGEQSIAIGDSAVVEANFAIQLGHGSNTTDNTFKVGQYINSSWVNYELLSAGGTIPSDRLVNAVNKYSTMPTASASNVGWIVQFTGTTDSTYTHGHLYECVSDGQPTPTYSWTEVQLGGGGSSLPSQTGNAGKFLTTDGTDASWATISALQNTATGTRALTILGTPSTYTNAINMGVSSAAKANNAVAIGFSTNASGGISIGAESSTNGNGVAIGTSAQAKPGGGNSSIAIGISAQANADGAIQIGAVGNYPTNSDANTFKVANINGNFEMMNANGNLPADRLASTSGLADGNYRLRLTIANGVPTLSWVAE